MITAKPTARGGVFDSVNTSSRLLWSRHQIVMMLRRYAREDRPVSVHYDNDDKVLVTRTLSVDADRDRVFFEFGSHKASNAGLLRCREPRFAIEDGASNSEFSSPRVSDVMLEGQPVFQIPIPNRIVQCDRRLHERVTIPEVSAPYVVFNLPDGRKAEGRLSDMSAGGIGVIGLAAHLKVEAGTVIRNCLILIDEEEQIVVDLEIRHAKVAMSTDGRLTHHVGFRLVSKPREFTELLKAFTVEF